MLIVSAATAAPEKVTSAGAVSAVANNTLIVLLVLVSVILPATVIAPVYEIVKVLEPFKAIVVAVMASLNACSFTCCNINICCINATAKSRTSSISINANEYDELPTVVVKVVAPVLVICTVPTPSLAPSTDPVTVIAAAGAAEGY